MGAGTVRRPIVRVFEWNPAGVYSDGCQHENSWTRDMHSFQFESLPTRVRFGSGIIAGLPEEAAHMGLSRLLLLSTPQQVELAERASALLGAEAVAQFNQARSEERRVGKGCVGTCQTR